MHVASSVLSADAAPTTQVKGVEFEEKAEDRIGVEQLKPPTDAASPPSKKGQTVHVSCA
jgi:hypothetical protein